MIVKTTLTIGIVVLLSCVTMVMTSFAINSKAEDPKFSPIVEAKMPEGFPQYTPVGEIQIKQYPAYRKAETKSSGAFWKLFKHIKKNDIAMTAPVEMTYSDAPKPKQQKMAFLYGSPDMGKLDQESTVKVTDVPAKTVVSTGVRGARTTKSVAEAHDRLKAWLESNQDRYSVAGELRVMGYNSPFVPRKLNYFEVEIPIRLIEKEVEKKVPAKQ